MLSSSNTQNKTKVFFKSNVSSRVLSCLHNNTQTSSLSSSSISNKPSSTTDNQTITSCTSTKLNPPNKIGRVEKNKRDSSAQALASPRVSIDQLNDLLDKHVLDTQSTHAVEIDDESNSSSDDDDLPIPSQSLPATPGIKRAYKGTSSSISISAKRLKNNAKRKEDFVDTENNDAGAYSSSFQKYIMNKWQRAEIEAQHTRQMFEELLSYHQRHQQTQTIILENQKKIKRVLLKHKIYVDVEDANSPIQDSQTDNDKDTFSSELLYTTDEGETWSDALLITGDRAKKNLYALKLVDALFTPEELLKINPLTNKNEIVQHTSYQFIKNAVRCKFRMTSKEMAVEWPNIHESILNKRRNWKKDGLGSNAHNTTISNQNTGLAQE